MKANINVSTRLISQNDNVLDFISDINLTKSTMVLVSDTCYQKIISDSNGTSGYFSTFQEKNILQHLDNDVVSISFSPLYSSCWMLLEYLHGNNLSYEGLKELPTNIVFIAFEEGDKSGNITVNYLVSNYSESPIDCIMKNDASFDNSLFFLTPDIYSKLKRNTSTISKYKGIERLEWELDNDYSGGSLLLNSVAKENLYLVESIAFPLISKVFSVKGFPNSIYFITT